MSLALAAGLWFTAKRGVAAAAAAFAFVFAVLDVAEVSHQLDEDRDGLAALAVAIAIGHALAAGRATSRTEPRGFAVAADPDGLTLRWDGPPDAEDLISRLLAYFEGDQPLTSISGLL